MLTYYLSKNGIIENPSCSARCYLIQNISHLILHCRATYSLCRSLFGELFSLYELLFRPWKMARLLGLHGLLPGFHPSEGVGQQQRKHQQHGIQAFF